MDPYFHTISVEPARWTPQRISQDLTAILPKIVEAGFRRLEVYEPHLASPGLAEAFRPLDVTPEILSSYLNLNPTATPADVLEEKIEELRANLQKFGIRRVRLFPGPGMKPTERSTFVERLELVLSKLGDIEILTETHDGSLADDPETVIQLVRDLAAPNVGLLYQPTVFKADEALPQFDLQLPYIRHIHFQNRHPDGSFSTMSEGIIPWDQIVSKLNASVTGTLEFVPLAICPVEKFDLAASLAQAQSEAEYIRSL